MPETRYFGCLGIKGYDSVVKIVDGCEAYIFNRILGDFKQNDDYLKAMYDPGSDYDEISEEKAKEIIRGIMDEK